MRFADRSIRGILHVELKVGMGGPVKTSWAVATLEEKGADQTQQEVSCSLTFLYGNRARGGRAVSRGRQVAGVEWARRPCPKQRPAIRMWHVRHPSPAELPDALANRSREMPGRKGNGSV